MRTVLPLGLSSSLCRLSFSTHMTVGQPSSSASNDDVGNFRRPLVTGVKDLHVLDRLASLEAGPLVEEPEPARHVPPASVNGFQRKGHTAHKTGI